MVDPIDVTGKAVTLSAVSLASFNGRLWMALGATYNGCVFVTVVDLLRYQVKAVEIWSA